MNSRTYRVRMWPLIPEAYGVLTWGDPTPLGRGVADWFLIPNCDDQTFEHWRYKFPVDERLADGMLALDPWLEHLEGHVKGILQARLDEHWLEQKFPPSPPVVGLELTRPASLLALRFEGRGEAALGALEDWTLDAETAAFARSLLRIKPLDIERIPPE